MVDNMLYTGFPAPWQWPATTIVFWFLPSIAVTSTLLVLVFLRALTISQQTEVPKCRPRHTPTHLLIVLGSGGHTAEMLSMLRRMPLDSSVYTYRTYIVSSGDSFSAGKAAEFEAELQKPRHDDTGEERGLRTGDAAVGQDGRASRSKSDSDSGSYTIVTVPRARRVHQSYLTAPFSTLQCFWACLNVLRGLHPDQKSHLGSMSSPYPDLILTNGPATAVCVILAAKLLRLLNFLFAPLTRPASSGEKHPRPLQLRTIFVESWARVKTLSLSGKILLPFADRFLVQWPYLEGKSAWRGMRKTEYVGTLVE
ncbi:hypothetical protein VTN00DRAFT_1302 [Thermoascus crustaceus]|uniref:uncharacterized protein n=1 Tax=Thermoascus crustaceus TaxID=5088 RepID=UPI003742F9FC